MQERAYPGGTGLQAPGARRESGGTGPAKSGGAPEGAPPRPKQPVPRYDRRSYGVIQETPTEKASPTPCSTTRIERMPPPDSSARVGVELALMVMLSAERAPAEWNWYWVKSVFPKRLESPTWRSTFVPMPSMSPARVMVMEVALSTNTWKAAVDGPAPSVAVLLSPQDSAGTAAPQATLMV